MTGGGTGTGGGRRIDAGAAEFRAAQRGRRVDRLNELESIAREEAVLAARRLTLLAEISGDYPAPIDHLHNEVALALGIRDVDAGRLIERGRVLTLGLPETMAALAAGSISEGHATAVVDAVIDTSPEIAARVDGFAVRLMRHEPLTAQQVYRRVHHQVIKLDPPTAERRHRQARTQRTLARRLSADGMATLRMYAPAEDVAAVWDACTVLAEAAESPDDDRDLGNRRVDSLVDLANGILDSGRLPDGAPADGGHRADEVPAAHPPVAGRAQADTEIGTGADTAAGTETGTETDAAAITTCSADSDWARWAAELADRPDLDEFEMRFESGEPNVPGEFDDDPSPATLLVWAAKYATEDAWLARATECAGPTSMVADRLPRTVRVTDQQSLSRQRRRVRPRPSVLMNVTVPIDLLLGDRTAVAEIPGIGPITAGQVAALIDIATLRRILCDPVTGEVLDVGRTRYVPTAPIARHVKMRDQTCVVPGCDQVAARCDLDHRLPFASGGETAASNLNCLCRRHHRAKDGGGFRLARTAAGWEWTTALGRTYTRPVTALYEPGDNYWPLNICQTGGFDPNRASAADSQTPATGKTVTVAKPVPVGDLSDEPPPF